MIDDIWEEGQILNLDPPGGIIRLEGVQGRTTTFLWSDCCRDGTSPDYLQVGDRIRRRVSDGAISSPNVYRWRGAEK